MSQIVTSRQKRLIVSMGPIGIIALLAVCLFTYFYLPSRIVQPYRYLIHRHTEVPLEHLYSQIPFKDSSHITITTYDGLAQDALWLEANAAEATVVCLHGIGACKELMLPLAGVFLRHRINVLLLDIRAQGASEGDYMTYGYRERYDVQAAVKWLEDHAPNVPIGIAGSSLGGSHCPAGHGSDARHSLWHCNEYL
jgi:uncharacterized protein